MEDFLGKNFGIRVCGEEFPEKIFGEDLFCSETGGNAAHFSGGFFGVATLLFNIWLQKKEDLS